jgi:murein DD-endopeptidase MepM/ murein hydrolase activator NlpD
LKKAVCFILLAAVLVVAGMLAYPWIDSALYAMRLSGMPAPTALPMPVADVKAAGLADTWHAARAPGRRHEGIDIFARRGTAVLSATEGMVLRRGEDRLGGNVVWVLGPAGHRHYYAHLETFADVATGDRVKPGTVLGTVGNTGNARTTPPHLHYGVYAVGGAINPYPLLAPGKR